MENWIARKSEGDAHGCDSVPAASFPRAVLNWTILWILTFANTSCRDSGTAVSNSASTANSSSVVTSPEVEKQIVTFCSMCHVMPSPDTFPKEAWYQEVKRGFNFYHNSGRTDGKPPTVQATVDYFRSRAPEKLVFPKIIHASPDSTKITFRLDEACRPKYSNRVKPAVTSFVRRIERKDEKPVLLLSDMADGGLHIWNQLSPEAPVTTLGTIRHPGGACECDLNGNGKRDIVVGDLGTFNPADHDQGQVVWIPDGLDAPGESKPVVIASGLGRVADVQAADLDGDGDLDLSVAEFGWIKTGRVLWMKNTGTASVPAFEVNEIDNRHGAIHVPIVDINKDGRPDIVALISQEYERIEAYLNLGEGKFDRQPVCQPGDPSFGSSGIEVIDFDQDGDLDVLYSNGDMFDSHLVKPYHGIQWLENQGHFPFESHHLCLLPGVHRALAGDVDRDGDIDVVACAMWPEGVRSEGIQQKLDSVIWLEQTTKGQFARHVVETGRFIHASMDLVDLDGDGDLDIVTGAFKEREDLNAVGASVWWNESQ